LLRGKIQKNSLIAVTLGILNLLDDDELEAVIGHELTHVKSRDVLGLTWAGMFSIVAWYLIQFGFFSGLRGRNSDTAGIIAIVLLVAVIM
jgi:heat shock protein HtpX